MSHSRPRVLFLFGMLLSGAAAEIFFCREACAAPNVIVLLSDDNGGADFGFMNQFTGGTTEFKTPNLDALAQQGKVFSQAYDANPVCAVSRAGLLTGRYPARFGFDYNVSNADDPNDGIPVSETLMTEKFKSMGYTTGVVGKWHVGAESAKQPQNQGVDDFFGIWGGSRQYWGANTAQTPVDQWVRHGTASADWTNEPSFNNVPPDPTRGRQLTDAFGDEATKFIANNANQSSPFFLYVPFTSPHSPFDTAKAQDVAQFNATSLTGTRKNVAALTYGMDRSIGSIMSRLNDPNGDGNQSDSIANNTLVVFFNDNGGADPSANTPTSNAPMRGNKGESWEGGIRTPMIMWGPGIQSGVFTDPVIATDLFPTLVAAAGGTMTSPTDGVNLLPYVSGQQQSAPHDELFWRGGVNYWAVRKGDWKLTRGNSAALPELYHLNANGTGEDTNLSASNPQKFQELLRDYVNWEVTLDKPRDSTAVTAHRFDVFVQRNLSTAMTWRWGSGWMNASNPSENVTLFREDSCPQTVLVFNPRDDANYTSINNTSRMTGIAYSLLDSGAASNMPGTEEFILNELRFDGAFAGASNRTGTLYGHPLMFVKNLSGQGPQITLNSTRAVSPNFTFTVGMDVVLYDDLEITGDSTLKYVIGGLPLGNNGQPIAGQPSAAIRDFYDPRSITKNGASTVIFAGYNTYGGNTIVNQGTLRIEGAGAALANTASVQIGPQGKLELISGLIHTPSLEIASGGIFNFPGGILQVGAVNGNLSIGGGELDPGLSTGVTQLAGNYSQIAGTLAIQIGGISPNNFDQLAISGNAQLGGNLRVDLLAAGGGAFNPPIGSVFNIITASGNISGTFSSINVPTLAGPNSWAILYGAKSVQLQVVASLPGDFNSNGVVDTADLSIWKQSQGVSALGDADFDGDTDGNDFLIWQRQLGARIISSTMAFAGVPEPSTSLQMLFAVLLTLRVRAPRGWL